MSSTAKPRLEFLDWARGIAAAIMLQGHVFDSFATGEQRQSSPFILSQFVGGMPPAIFLFLTGVTLAFLLESQERKGLSLGQKLMGVAFRARYLLLIAILFRVQLWLFAWPYGAWTDLLKVDILNCMGASILLLSPLALLGRLDRIRYSLLAGASIALAAPLVSNADWRGVPEVVRHYLAPSPMFFPIFPWTAFLAFGVAAGTVLKTIGSRDLGQFALWAGLAGFVLTFGAQRLSDIPYSIYPKSDFWLDSPWLVFIKLGLTLILLAIAYLWTAHLSTGWSWIRQLGSTSLLIYWVHTELVYGRWLHGLKGNLTIPQIVLLAVTVILAMIGLSVVRTQGPQWWATVMARSNGLRIATRPAEGD